MRGSESDRALTCPASLVLPRTPRPSGDAAQFGTLCHHWKETGETDPAWANPGHTRTLEKKLLLSGIDRDVWWCGGEHEVTYALHLVTHTLHRYAGHRDDASAWKASFGAEWLTGTIDYLYPDGRGDDLKTGRHEVDPATSGQLKSYALFPWVEAGKPFQWGREWTITQWPRYPVAEQPRRRGVVLSGFELGDHLASLAWSTAHPEEVVPSEAGCRWCECRPTCPAHVDERPY